MGRKDKYQTNVLPRLHEIPKMYDNMSEGQICKALGIARSSWENYKNRHPELVEALSKGKQRLAEELKDILRQKAKGFNYEERKTTVYEDKEGNISRKTETYVKYAQPDTGAIHLLLKNLDADWHNADKQELAMKREELELKKQKAAEDAW